MVADVTMSLRSRLRDRTRGVVSMQAVLNRVKLTLPEEPHQDVRAQGTLVRLIKDDNAIPIQISLVQRLAKQNTIRHDYIFYQQQ